MSDMQILETYKKHIRDQRLSEDQRQLAIIPYLQTLYAVLLKNASNGEHGFVRRTLESLLCGRRTSIQHCGIYLWGSVGSGKTLLLDLLFEQLSFIPQKRKIHFHAFIQDIHHHLKQIEDTKNPLKKVARNIAKNAKVLFLDEFYVSDISDAMILSNLFACLFDEKVNLLISSNCRPSDLYRDGLQRQRFMPAIELIEEKLCVKELTIKHDYRMRFLEKRGLYNVLPDEQVDALMFNTYQQLNQHNLSDTSPIQIEQRLFQPIQATHGSIWFQFEELCVKARSAKDYIAIAQRYPIVFVSDIPVFDDTDDIARRFINMIDCFYNTHTILICSAKAQPQSLYCNGNLQREFQRTASRLIEMQSDAYTNKDM